MADGRLRQSEIRRLAGLELNALLCSGLLPLELFDGARLPSAGTPIHDLNGEVLYRRLPIVKRGEGIGYADVAAQPAFGAPLLAVAPGRAWDGKSELEAAAAAARKVRRGLRYDRMRFVAYSYPKLAVQFLRGREEVLLLEYGTWRAVPAARERKREEPPSDFERWSFLDEMPAARAKANARKFAGHVERWDKALAEVKLPELMPRVIDREFCRIWPKLELRVDARDLHYSTNNADHSVCFELRGQETSVWCVGASVQMLLLFYRYQYAQTRLAQELGLGTLKNPNGLPYANDFLVVDVIEKLSSNALDASMNTAPTWAEFRNEIRANRPLISFIPGHSRAVAGYTERRLLVFPAFRGLLVYDPWPPNVGVITRWENFDTMTYRRTFTARVTLV